METINWSKIQKSISANKVEFETNKCHFTKIAFDVFQLNNSPVESLWILEDGEDGKQYLVATYDDLEAPIQSTGNWSTLQNKKATEISLYYRGVALHKFASVDFGFTPEDAYLFQRSLINKLNTDRDFVRKLIDLQPIDKKESIFKQFPELLK